MSKQISTNKNNVVDLFSKKPAVANHKVDYSLVDQLHGRRRNQKSSKTAHRDNLVVMFPGFCA